MLTIYETFGSPLAFKFSTDVFLSIYTVEKMQWTIATIL